MAEFLQFRGRGGNWGTQPLALTHSLTLACLPRGSRSQTKQLPEPEGTDALHSLTTLVQSLFAASARPGASKLRTTPATVVLITSFISTSLKCGVCQPLAVLTPVPALSRKGPLSNSRGASRG